MTKAPYNFIKIENKVIKRSENRECLPKHNKYDLSLNTGYIECSIEIETPTLISAGKKDKNNSDEIERFMKNPNGEYIIPGNTMRGLIRSTASIFSLGSLVNDEEKRADIENQRFFYRTFASSDSSKKWYANKTGMKQEMNNNKRYTVLRNVRGGYLYKKDGEYYIAPAKMINTGVSEKSYFPVEEKELKSEMINSHKNYLYNDFDCKKVNEGYTPYSKLVQYNLKKNGKPIISKKGSFSGLLTNSRNINEKKNHYLIFEEDKNQKMIRITKEQAHIYKKDLERTNKLRQNEDGLFYYLEQKNYPKAIFYIKENENLIFGFTPYLRIPADGDIYDGIPESHRNFKGYDYTDGIFGTMKYRTRVSFQDLVGEKCVICDNYDSMVLGTPKPSWYKGYLKKDGYKKDISNFYGDKAYSLRGRKFYWMKEKDITKTGNGNKNILTKAYFMEKGIFKGRIHFENLNDAELGLLLFSIKENQKVSIGKGKPYGYGRVKMSLDKLFVEDIEKRYVSFFAMDTEDASACEKLYIDAFKKEMTGKYKRIDEISSICEFRKSKKIQDSSKVSYMDLNDFSKAVDLPTLDEVYSGKQKERVSNYNYKKKNNSNSYNNHKPKKKFNDKKYTSSGSNEPFNPVMAKFKDLKDQFNK